MEGVLGSKLSGVFILLAFWPPHEDWLKLHPEIREKEVFGDLWEEGRRRRASVGRAIYSDRYRLLQLEAGKKKHRTLKIGRP